MADFDDIPELVTGDEPDLNSRLSQLDANTNYLTEDKLQFYKETLKKRKEDNVRGSVARKIPITIITGYLGSGKSTLLDHIAKRGDKKFAIILNEFGDSSEIEKSLTVQNGDAKYEEWLDLGNGCLCCAVKDNGVQAIEDLIERSGDKIDYILLETSGIADPAPIARMFWLDDGLRSNVYIDGVVTVLDSEHISTCLDDVGGHWHESNGLEFNEEGITTAHLQIALADVILLNKSDKMTDAHKLENRIKQINSIAPIYETQYGDIDVSKILDLHSFEKSIKLNNDDKGSFHDSRISTVSVDFGIITEEQFKNVELFIQYILWESNINEKPVEIHRAKGIFINNKNEGFVLQGVRDTYEIIPGASTDLQTSKIVLIGKNLNKKDVLKELKKQTGIIGKE